MKNQLELKEILILSLVVFALACSLLFKSFSDHGVKSIFKISESYEMIRANAFKGTFSLDQRDVDHQVFQNTQKVVKAAEIVLPKIDPAKAKAAQIAEAKKKADLLKKAVTEKNAKAKVAAAKLEAASKLKVSLYNTREAQRMAGLAKENSADTTYNQNEKQVGQLAVNKPPLDTKEPLVEEKEQGLTATQWESLLFAEPTTENAKKFYSAFKNRKVSEDDFYALLEKMLNGKKTEVVQRSVEIFKQAYSAQSFEVLAHGYDSMQDAETKKTVNEIMTSYGNFYRFGILAQTLHSKNAVTLKYSTTILKMAVDQAKNTANQTGQPVRTLASPTNVKSFEVFLNGLEKLKTNTDSTVASSAQSLIADINALIKK